MTYIKFTGPLWGKYLLVSTPNAELVRKNLINMKLKWQESK
mgnify:FL=1